jgi:CheY-like chemotaxis protein
LRRVIINLLSNAIKFTPEQGSIGLFATLVREEGGSCDLRIEVSDTGIGLSHEQREKLFTAFEQADTGISREYGGTGLGLSISKHIVERMGGKIWVESELGKGARFIFTVMIESGRQDSSPGPAIVDASEGKSEADMNEKFAGKKLLIVEDVEINREILIAMLEDTEISIDCAVNGLDAVEKIAASPDMFDVVLMDVQMPKMDGHEATRQIRVLTAQRLTRLPIIAMTAHVFKSDVEECLAAGMDDHIGKPIDSSKLIDSLEKWLAPGAIDR